MADDYAGKIFSAACTGAWSAMQCLAHLNSYGDYYLPEIEKAIRNAKAHSQSGASYFTPGRLGNYFTNMMNPGENGLPAKKMKAFKAYIPASEGNSDQVIATFIEQQEKLFTLIEAAKAIDLNKTKVPVSIAKFIKLKLGDVFMFLIAHNYRHVLQAERALQQAGAPAAQKKTAPLQYLAAMFFKHGLS
jgi:hypothetical protein